MRFSRTCYDKAHRCPVVGRPMSAMLEINVTAREQGWVVERTDLDKILYLRHNRMIEVTYCGNWVLRATALLGWAQSEVFLTSRDRDKKKRILSFLTASVDSPIKLL
jgi:hypothetical protein